MGGCSVHCDCGIRESAGCYKRRDALRTNTRARGTDQITHHCMTFLAYCQWNRSVATISLRQWCGMINDLFIMFDSELSFRDIRALISK